MGNERLNGRMNGRDKSKKMRIRMKGNGGSFIRKTMKVEG